MSKANKERLLDYKKKKAAGLERIRKNAQVAYKRAQEEKRQGDVVAALQWMERAYRLTRDNPNIIFDLALLYLKLKNYKKAYALLKPLMRKFDFYEGWIALALIYSHQHSNDKIIQILHYILSRYCPTSQTWILLIRLLKQTGNKIGCCGLVGSLNQLWLELFTEDSVKIYLDDQFVLETNQRKIILPAEWENFKKLRVESQGKALVGSAIDIHAINRKEGYVEVIKDKVTGWIWYPAEPERIPCLTIEDQDGNIYKRFNVTEKMDVITLDIPLFRPKSFSVPCSDLPMKKLFFKDSSAQDLIGSPFDPFLEQRGIDFLVSLQTPKMQDKKISVQTTPHFFPVAAAFKGQHPRIDSTNALGIVIIIPVYKGIDTTLACLKQVLKTVSKHIIIQLVNDCSPETGLIQSLNGFIDNKQVFCIHHTKNKGFPAAVNSGMADWVGYDIILLNSDTLVCKGWLEALCHAAYSQKDIGTVTPFSNDASIFSYPYYDKENPVPSLQNVDTFNKLFKKIHTKLNIEIPTANGFCMFIRHDCLAQTGLFREDLFAQGYGEENDFCMRARHLGWRHVLALDVFVGHQGGISFQNAKNFLSQRNTNVLNRLYPGYDDLIQDYIQQDPLLFFRRKIDIERIRKINLQEQKKGSIFHYVLLITHRNGGGVERAVQERANIIRLQGKVPIIVRPILLDEGCQLEIQFQSSVVLLKEIEWLFPNLVFKFPQDEKTLWKFLQKLTIDYVEIHHLYDHHDFIRQLAFKLKKPYRVYIHDYFAFCPRGVLLNAAQEYCGDPVDLEICQKCVNVRYDEDEPVVDMIDWIDRSRNELEQAECIYVPSYDVLQRMRKHFPNLNQFKIRNLEDDKPDLSIKQLSFFSQKYVSANSQHIYKDYCSDRYKVCFIGAIGIEKGFGVIQALIQDADKRNLPLEFIVIGRTSDDNVLMQSNRVFVTGEYKEEEAVSLVMEQKADLAFFPSICPETWCYALSVAWRAGLKTVSYDIGAIAERIKKTKRGYILPSHFSIANQNNFLLEKCKSVDR